MPGLPNTEPVTQDQLAAIAASIPQVQTTGSATTIGQNTPGSSPAAASADHVHNFGPALQRVRVAAGATTTWIFDTPFTDRAGNPIQPVVSALIECPASGTAFSEPLITSLSSTACTISLKAQATSISISLGAFTLFGGAIPANTFLHLVARNPSV